MTTPYRKTLNVPALRLVQDGHQIYVTKMRAEDMEHFTKIDRYNPDLAPEDENQGYQRAEETPRVKKLANWLRAQLDDEAGVLMPTALLASSRSERLPYDEPSMTLTLSSDRKLELVDGQHRRAGLLYAINEKGRDELRDFEVPLLIVEGLTRYDEMRQFATVNGTQKSVRTDLVNMILTQLAASEGDDSIREREQWKVVVSRVLNQLNADTVSPWFNMVVMPNEAGYKKSDFDQDPDLKHQKLVRATSFMTSLKPLYDYFAVTTFDVQSLSTEERAVLLADVVNGFWKALRKLNPDVFATPGDYVMQKTPGLFALHRLCKRLLPVMHSEYLPWDENGFAKALEPSSELQNPEFWSAKNGDAAKYGSMKGFAELADLLWETLQP